MIGHICFCEYRCEPAIGVFPDRWQAEARCLGRVRKAEVGEHVKSLDRPVYFAPTDPCYRDLRALLMQD